jgi:hypothetical protein
VESKLNVTEAAESPPTQILATARAAVHNRLDFFISLPRAMKKKTIGFLSESIEERLYEC